VWGVKKNKRKNVGMNEKKKKGMICYGKKGTEGEIF